MKTSSQKIKQFSSNAKTDRSELYIKIMTNGISSIILLSDFTFVSGNAYKCSLFTGINFELYRESISDKEFKVDEKVKISWYLEND